MQNLIIEIILTFNFSNSLIRSNSFHRFHHCAFNFDFLSFPLFKSRNYPIFLFSVLSLFIDVCFSIFFFFFFNTTISFFVIFEIRAPGIIISEFYCFSVREELFFSTSTMVHTRWINHHSLNERFLRSLGEN